MNVDLVSTLLRLERERATGVVEVGQGEAQTRLFLDHGTIVLAEEGVEGETLGRLLLNGSVLSPDAYSQVVERMAQAKGKRQAFGDVVIELGILTHAQVDAAVSAQVRQKVIRCVRIPDVKFGFKIIPAPPKSMARHPVSVRPLVLFALRMGDRERLAALLGGEIPQTITLLHEPALVGELFDLRSAERAFLAKVDGKKQVGELIEGGAEGGIDVPVLLAALVVCGAAKLEAARHPSVPPARLNELIATPMKALRRSMTKRPPPGSRVVARKAIASWKAHKTQAPPPPRRRYPTPAEDWQKLLIGEAAFLRGKQLVQDSRFGEARPELAMAAKLVPQSIEYRLYADWAELRADPTKEADALTAVKDLAQRAIDEDPALGFALEVLAHVAMREGDYAQSGKYLDRAKRLGASGSDGRMRIRMLPRKKPFAAKARAARPELDEDDAGQGVYLMPAPEVAPVPPASPAVEAPRPAPMPTKSSPVTTFLTVAILLGALGGAAVAAVVLRPGPPKPVPPKSGAATAASAVPAPSGGTGRIRGEDWTRGRRLLLDHEYVGDGPGPIEVPCGAHEVQVGTAGNPHPLVVPCGGEVLVK